MARKYFWDRWFGGAPTTIVRGVDYHCSQSTMVATVRNSASMRHLRVKLVDNGDSIVIQVVGRTRDADEVPDTDKVAITS